jgi:RHS repeat-associated protein
MLRLEGLMKAYFLIFLFLPIYLLVSLEEGLESLDQDPCLFQHVNVISGQLSLTMQDSILQGAHPFQIIRTYSSIGALEVQKDNGDLQKKDLRGGWLLQGGWNFLPHANLLIMGADEFSFYSFYLPEPSGAVLCYEYSHKVRVKGNTYHFYFKPKHRKGSHNSTLGAKHDPYNNELIVRADLNSSKDFEVSVFLAGGGSRQYRKLNQKRGLGSYYYKLTWEDLPSGRCIDYKYDNQDRLHRIEIKNPKRNIVHSWIQIDILREGKPFEFRVTTSDNRSFLYKGKETSNREYFGEVISSSAKSEKFDYSAGTDEMGARVSQISFEGQLDVQVEYYNSSTPFRYRNKKYYEKHRKVDRVKELKVPMGPSGEMKRIARFQYENGYTDIKDVDGVLHRYHHNNEDKVSWIERFYPDGTRHSSIRFLWRNEKISAKALFDGEDKPIFSKTFAYDERGNVIEETLWGNITGKADESAFKIKENGSLANSDHYRRYYKYDENRNLLLWEEDEDALRVYYGYKDKTDLVLKKITRDQKGIIVRREFFVYDENHFVIAEMIDDGITPNPDDLTGVTQRLIKRYEIDHRSGLVHSLQQFGLDCHTGQEVLIQKHVYGYQCHNLKETEEVYDAFLQHRYTLTTHYDDHGNVILQTTPRGGVNTYEYDKRDHLLLVKEVGLPEKRYVYDALGRAISCTEIDAQGNEKITYTTYANKGWIIEQEDFLGNTTKQEYDSFGKCILTQFADVKDERGNPYTPIIYFTYDVVGNLVSHTNPKGETTKTWYNALQKPTLVLYPDGTKVEHIYNRNGSLSETIEQDGVHTFYYYDSFGRVTGKYGKDTWESWEYNTFHLLCYEDQRGLRTSFTYDAFGRKVAERAENRLTTYSYDSLGFLHKTTFGDLVEVAICDVEGHVIEKWEQRKNSIQNHMKMNYTISGMLEKSSRMTSQGEAIDLFFYDAEGRLSRYIDPLGAEKRFVYEQVRNDLGQMVLCKTTIDPLGCRTVEIEDACNRIISKERQDSKGKTVSLEELCYDRAGNVAKKMATVYLKDSAIKQITHLFDHDSMGRVIKELIAGKRATYYTYDVRGNIQTKTLPSGLSLSYVHDSLNRILSLRTSDGSINYQYQYEDFEDNQRPNIVTDCNTGKRVLRKYNLFGEVEEEITEAGKLVWEYDDFGRCIRFILPDSSSILYGHELGALTTVTRINGAGVPLYTHTYTKLDQNGHVEEEECIGGLGRIVTTHDLMERPSLQRNPWNMHFVSYDKLSRVDAIESSLFGQKTLQYDPLSQLTQEGDKSYLFDSMGNSSFYEVNDLNEVLSTNISKLEYDLDGNLIKRESLGQTIYYSYDGLGRLSSITYPDRKVVYTYDPFSRLFSKQSYEIKDGNWRKNSQCGFLYDQDKEIGCFDRKGMIFQLKVLGRGIGADIGAAVAVELYGKPYMPLHDFSGNCIGLVSLAGELVEQYRIDAFGKETTTPSQPKNPWRFCSKRHEEGFVFFGFRFYDCELERWLTPDPAGFVDGMNLYLYVCNSPYNRLDLFGLSSELAVDRDFIQGGGKDPFSFQGLFQAQLNGMAAKQRNAIGLVKNKEVVDGVSTDFLYINGSWHKMQFSVDDLTMDTAYLLNHFVDSLPKTGTVVGLVSFQNGINTTREEFEQTCKSIMTKVPEGTLFMGIYNPTKGILLDVFRVFQERMGLETPTVKRTAQCMQAAVQTLHKINPNLVWFDIHHSEGGLIARRAVEMLPQEDRELMKQHWYCLAIGPAKMVPMNYGLGVYNVYSRKDYITKRYAKETKDGFNYSVHWVPSISPMKERTMCFADHAIMGKTYQRVIEEEVVFIRKGIGFYENMAR